MTHAVRTFLAMLELEKISQFDFARRAGVSHSTITRFVQGRVPSPDLLKHLATRWTEPQHGLEVLRAHLLDEIERGGRDSHDFSIETTGGTSDAALGHALEVLAREADIDTDLRTTLLGLAGMIERHRGRAIDTGNLGFPQPLKEGTGYASAHGSVAALAVAEDAQRGLQAAPGRRSSSTKRNAAPATD